MQPIEQVLNQYNLGTVAAIEPISGGIIHRTWKVATDRGAFVAQEVSPIFAPAVMEDIVAVLEYLRGAGAIVMDVVRTRSGNLFVPGTPGFSRVFTYVPGVVHEAVSDERVASAAGELLGRYHRLLDTFRYEFKHRRPIKHNISALYEAYRKAVAGTADSAIAPFLPAIERMRGLDLPAHFRKHAHHGDAKISNFIFALHEPARAVTMVDFDDCGRSYNILHELGGFFRSACWTIRGSANEFSLEQFRAALAGYAEGSRGFLTNEERQYLPQVLQLNLLQLASRFIRDYVADSYFAWDPAQYPSRKAHNLARAREHLGLYEDIVRKHEAIEEIVREAYHA